MIELGHQTFMSIQTLDLHRVPGNQSYIAFSLLTDKKTWIVAGLNFEPSNSKKSENMQGAC